MVVINTLLNYGNFLLCKPEYISEYYAQRELYEVLLGLYLKSKKKKYIYSEFS
jgi:hypothetical protein